MKPFFVFLISCLIFCFNLHAQCDSNINITGKYGTMPQSANVTQNITIDNSSTTPGQIITYKAGESIDINQDFDAVPEGQIIPNLTISEGVVDMQIEQGNYDPYTIGAWYHTSWYLDWFWADRNSKYVDTTTNHASDNLNDFTAHDPNLLRIADVWSGVRNVALGNDYYSTKIPEMLSDPNYNKSRKPLLGFYDLSDQRIIDNHIQMAASRGIKFFSFYNYYDTDGDETGSNRIVQRFKSSLNKNLMKYMISIWQPETFDSFNNSGVYNFQTFVTTILNQLTDPNSTNLDPSYLTNKLGQPIIAISPSYVFIHNGISDHDEADLAFNQLVTTLRNSINTKFGKYPIVLLVTDTSWEGGRAKNLMTNNPTLYDGYIGFQQLINTATAPNFNTDYGNLSITNPMGSAGSINDVLIESLNNTLVNPNNTKYNIPVIMSGFDVRPWIPNPNTTDTDYAKRYFSNNSPGAFSKMLDAYKTYIDQNNSTSHNMLMCYAWNEWGESGLLEPSEAYGYGYLDALKNTFCLQSNGTEPSLVGFSTSYEEWVTSINWNNITDNQQKLQNADPDNDGLPNIMEYAFGTSPGTADGVNQIFQNTNLLPYYFQSSNEVTLKYNRDYKKNDLIYFVEASEHPNSSYSMNSDDEKEEEWWLFDDTNWGKENDSIYKNYVIPFENSETVTTRRHKITNLSIQRLRLVIGYINSNGVTEKYFFPPTPNDIGYKMSNNTIKNTIIYPNPSKNGLFDVNLRDNTKAFLEITNIIGQRITFNSLHEENKIKLDLTDKASGIYLVKITQNNISETFKLIIEK